MTRRSPLPIYHVVFVTSFLWYLQLNQHTLKVLSLHHLIEILVPQALLPKVANVCSHATKQRKLSTIVKYWVLLNATNSNVAFSSQGDILTNNIFFHCHIYVTLQRFHVFISSPEIIIYGGFTWSLLLMSHNSLCTFWMCLCSSCKYTRSLSTLWNKKKEDLLKMTDRMHFACAY